MRVKFRFLLAIGFLSFLLLGVASAVRAEADQKLKIYFFWGKNCPHCAKEKVFLEKLVNDYPQLELESLELSRPENIKLWQLAGEKLGAEIGYTPFTVVGNRHFVGFLNEETTGREIEKAVQEALEEGCTNILEHSASSPCPDNQAKGVSQFGPLPEKLKLPLLGEIETRNVSLPFLTIALGVLDGFNPCAMWTLLFLISLLLGMEDKKRMWILGTAFVITSAFVYFLFLSAWLNLFLVMGFISWVRIIVGLVALGAGFYSLRDYLVNKAGGCQVAKGEKRQKVFARIKEITQKKNFFLALGGIILLALAVNLVELVCSAGLPAIYTQVLSLNQLPGWQYYLYLLGYVFFFMVDDLFVFFTAMITLRAVGIETKYARFSRLFGGLIILIIGLLLIFKPGWLTFA